MSIVNARAEKKIILYMIIKKTTKGCRRMERREALLCTDASRLWRLEGGARAFQSER
jgi:hypothetical protein